MIPPTSMDFDYYRGMNVLTDIGQLKRALAEGGSVDSERTLGSFYAFREIPDPCARFWEVMEDGQAAMADPDAEAARRHALTAVEASDPV